MAAETKTVDSYPACTAPTANDVLLGKGNVAANTFKYSIKNLLGNSSANVTVANSMVLSANTAVLKYVTIGNASINTVINSTALTANAFAIRSGNDTINTFIDSTLLSISNSTGTSYVNSVCVSTANVLQCLKNTSPANSIVGGEAVKSIWWDDNWLYVTISDGTIKRAALSLF